MRKYANSEITKDNLKGHFARFYISRVQLSWGLLVGKSLTRVSAKRRSVARSALSEFNVFRRLPKNL